MKRSKMRRSTKRHSRKRSLSSGLSHKLRKRSIRLSKKQRKMLKRLSRQVKTRFSLNPFSCDDKCKARKEIERTGSKAEENIKNNTKRQQKLIKDQEEASKTIKLLQDQQVLETNKLNNIANQLTSKTQELQMIQTQLDNIKEQIKSDQVLVNMRDANRKEEQRQKEAAKAAKEAKK